MRSCTGRDMLLDQRMRFGVVVDHGEREVDGGVPFHQPCRQRSRVGRFTDGDASPVSDVVPAAKGLDTRAGLVLVVCEIHRGEGSEDFLSFAGMDLPRDHELHVLYLHRVKGSKDGEANLPQRAIYYTAIIGRIAGDQVVGDGAAGGATRFQMSSTIFQLPSAWRRQRWKSRSCSLIGFPSCPVAVSSPVLNV